MKSREASSPEARVVSRFSVSPFGLASRSRLLVSPFSLAFPSGPAFLPPPFR